jgi:hypothetical protein
MVMIVYGIWCMVNRPPALHRLMENRSPHTGQNGLVGAFSFSKKPLPAVWVFTLRRCRVGGRLCMV